MCVCVCVCAGRGKTALAVVWTAVYLTGYSDCLTVNDFRHIIDVNRFDKISSAIIELMEQAEKRLMCSKHYFKSFSQQNW